MNLRIKIVSTLLSLLIVSKLFSSTIIITPSGTGDDSNLIQTTLNGLHAGDILILNGNFIHKKTIYLPSDFTWILNGSLTLGNNAVLDKVGWVKPGIDARRSTGISETPGGATNIDMSGGTYSGNVANNSSSLRYINFVSVTKSRFHDMVITQVSDDNFTLGPGCNNNECRNLLSNYSRTGNALTDKGDYNKWYDCIAEYCLGDDGDGWTPKCRNSEFHRCIARYNGGPGFGMFCRIDGSGNPVDLGESIDNNKFYDCISHDNKGSGFSFNIASTSGEGGSIRNNYIQAVCYNNAESGVKFRNKMPNSIADNNEINLLCYGNRGESKSGVISSTAGGLGNDANSTYKVTGITGTIVSYNNIVADVNIDNAYNCSITVYHPIGEKSPVLKRGDASNKITVIDFNCSDLLSTWCQQEYCERMTVVEINNTPLNTFHLSQNYPNPFNTTTIIEYTISKESYVSLKIYDISGREISTLVNGKKQKGYYKTELQRKGLPDGTYFYRIQIGDFAETKKFVLK